MYYNRDLSWLGFNYRVLQEAACPEVPLLERFKFLSIFSSNLDEFFRVRYPSLLAVSKLNPKTRKRIITEENEDIADKIQTEVNRQQKEFGEILIGQLLPELEQQGIVLYYDQPLREEHRAEVRELFLSRILAFVQPVFLEGDVRNVFLPENSQLYLINTMRKAGEIQLHHAAVKIPTDKQPRFFKLSPLDGKEYIIFIDDLIRENTDCIFPGFEVTGSYSIKFNRDAELILEDEYSGDLLRKIEKQLKKRDFGPPSRFLYEEDMPRNVQMFIASSFGVTYEEMFSGRRYHNLRDLAELPVKIDALEYSKRKPLSSPELYDCSDIFNLIERRDVLLHFPYDSYNPILAFFNQSAIDPCVEEIYITLYRVASDSLIVNALISAAKNGKKVTVFIELKARFDEANNIQWSKKMAEAGIRIVFSIPEIKVHSKIALVIKRDGAVRKSFSILSTGNFNESTARFYTDHTLLTSNAGITGELFSLFQFLKQRKKPTGKNELLFRRLFVSQFNMISGFERLIEAEMTKARRNKGGRIRIKVNNLEEPHMIALLYKASQAGVRVQLIARSICCLVPGLNNLSENIEVRRIVDRYLEHTRLFIFGDADDVTLITGSSDWMTRNLRRRIEVCTTIDDPICKRELLDYFELQWMDNDKAVRLLSTMSHEKVAGGEHKHNAQDEIYKYLLQRI
ncbi:MAG TPA: polyphosphate kinase 1 [Flavipsychrobacter sp.]|nr:polyphosphate kinase 1 [Flavipsychrobacter sp.]